MADCKVNVFGVTVEYEQGATYAEIAKDYKEKVDGDIILVTVNGKLCELHKKIADGSKVEFVTTKDSVGNDTYVRGAIFLMLKAFYNVLGKDKIKKISVEHTLGKAVYCDYEGKEALSNELLNKVKQEMRELADADLPILKKSAPTSEAIKMFRDLGMHDKEKLFKYRSASSTNYYELDGFKDYFYGYMPASTGILKVFDLMLYADGFLLLLPDVSDPTTVADYEDRPLLFKTQHEANEWGKVMGLETVGDLNEQICNGNIEDMILVQEALQ